MTPAATSLAVAALVTATVRWLRVAQRDHYVAGSTTRFALLWWRRRPPNPALAAAGLAAAAGALWAPVAGMVTSVIAAAAPLGLPVRGRRSRLQWTPRMRRLGGVLLVEHGVLLGSAVWLGLLDRLAPALALLAPVWIDAALAVTRPLEHRLSRHYVARATRVLADVAPTTVAIAGSYGKTSTKEHVRDLLEGSYEVLASPRTWNNRLGLARAVNELMSPAVEVFVAETGTWHTGEIAALCSWIRPRIGVLTAIGPVHLNRMGSLDAITEAKSEVFATASVAVVNGDDERVCEAARRAPAPTEVVRCSAHDLSADVTVTEGRGRLDVFVRGEWIGSARRDLFPINVACAVGVALVLGIDPPTIGERLARLAPATNRRTIEHSANGVTFVNQTANSNPVAAAAALRLFEQMVEPGRRAVVVTPGLVELGPAQREENAALTRAVSVAATHLVVVGYTNRAALSEGARGSGAEVVGVPDRRAAVRWLRSVVEPGDLVLWDNDLPERYP